MPRSPSPSAAAATSTRSTILNHSIAPFYCCYLLRSHGGKRTACYIGSSPDPPRRIREHNGQLKGGAVKTRYGRPWEQELIVYNFPTKLQALQFEWAWQNPDKSRLLKATLPSPSASASSSPTAAATATATAQFPRSALSNKPLSKVQVLQYMLTSPPWSAFDLRVLLFGLEAQTWWETAKEVGPTLRTEAGVRKAVKMGQAGWMGPLLKAREERLRRVRVDLRREGVDGERRVRLGEVEEDALIGEGREEKLRVDDDVFFESHWAKWTSLVESGTAPTCGICSKPVNAEDHLSFLLCTSPPPPSSEPSSDPNPHAGCRATYHLPCLASHFLPPSTISSSSTSAANPVVAPPLLPVEGTCPSCRSPLHWQDLVRGAYRRKEEAEGKRKRRKGVRKVKVAGSEVGEKPKVGRGKKKKVARKAGGKGKGKAVVQDEDEDDERFDLTDLEASSEEGDSALEEAEEEQERSWAQAVAQEGALLSDGEDGGDFDDEGGAEEDAGVLFYAPSQPEKLARSPLPFPAPPSPTTAISPACTKSRKKVAVVKPTTGRLAFTASKPSSTVAIVPRRTRMPPRPTKKKRATVSEEEEEETLPSPRQIGRRSTSTSALKPKPSKTSGKNGAEKKTVAAYIEISD